ncbi:heterokaryon incompatibility protein-domain-containing protein [Apiospora arundinis]
MSALLLSRTALRRTALLGTGLSFSLGTAAALQEHRRPLRMDALSVPRPFTSQSSEKSPAAATKAKGGLDPDMLRQLSGGSVSGFLAGLLVSVFSKTLVLLLGISVVIVQVAARYGVDLVDQLRVKQRVKNSRVLEALRKDPAFKLSFGFFFAASAFLRFGNV